jgi:hypothetical protein
VDYKMTSPCDACPFLNKYAHAFTLERLGEFASGELPCHKTAEWVEGEEGTQAQPKQGSHHCAGALIFNEKRERPHQMMRICERLGMYDYTKLNMEADVR